MSDAVVVEDKKSKVGRFLVPALAVLVLLGLVFQGILEGQRQNRGETAPGKPAPDFRMQKLTGGVVTLDELQGKVVMIDFWATWCPPCVEEMPHLTKLAREYESKGLVFIAANRDEPDLARYLVEQFIQRRVTDLGPYVAFADDSVTDAFGVSSLPTLYFVDREGNIHSSFLGYAPEDVLRERIEEALQ